MKWFGRKSEPAPAPVVAPAPVAAPAPEQNTRAHRRRGGSFGSRGTSLKYDAAATGRRTDNWTTTGNDANAETGPSLSIARNRSRDLARNNPHAIRALERLTNSIVGSTGIRPRFKGPNAAKLKAAWEAFVADCDVTHGLNLCSLETLCVRTWLESGGTIVRRRWRRPEDGILVPLQLQILEPDHLDASKDYVFPTGARIVQGVEFDPIGRRSAYHLYPFHPGDQYGQYVTSTRVSADDIAHLYRATRPGQINGMPLLTGVARALRDIDDAADAERIRRKIESCVTAFVTGGDPESAEDGNDGIAPAALDSTGNIVETLEPGLIVGLPPGKEVKFSSPTAIGGLSEYLRDENRRVAVGASQTYEGLTGDMSQVNYTSYRAGELVYRANVRVLQEQIVIPLLMEPIVGWFLDAVIVAGLARLTDADVYEWVVPPFDEVDREKEMKADGVAVRMGFDSMPRVLAKYGRDAMDIATEQAEFLKFADGLGLVFDSDPRKTSGSGQTNATQIPQDGATP